MSASAIGREMGINQSSATRLLQSLQQANLVYKPSYQSFAIDLGLLRLAGIALNSFPMVSRAVHACNRLRQQHAYGYSVATLLNHQLIYLAHLEETPSAALVLVDHSHFPLHQSSLGLCLAYSQGEKKFRSLLEHQNLHQTQIEAYWDFCEQTMTSEGYISLDHVGRNKSNSALSFEFKGRTYAFAVFCQEQNIPKKISLEILHQGLQLLKE